MHKSGQDSVKTKITCVKTNCKRKGERLREKSDDVYGPKWKTELNSEHPEKRCPSMKAVSEQKSMYQRKG